MHYQSLFVVIIFYVSHKMKQPIILVSDFLFKIKKPFALSRNNKNNNTVGLLSLNIIAIKSVFEIIECIKRLVVCGVVCTHTHTHHKAKMLYYTTRHWCRALHSMISHNTFFYYFFNNLRVTVVWT